MILLFEKRLKGSNAFLVSHIIYKCSTPLLPLNKKYLPKTYIIPYQLQFEWMQIWRQLSWFSSIISGEHNAAGVGVHVSSCVLIENSWGAAAMAAASHVTSLLIPLWIIQTLICCLWIISFSLISFLQLCYLYTLKVICFVENPSLLLGRSKSFTTSKLCINSYMIRSNDSKHDLLKPISKIFVIVLIDLARLYNCPSR